MLLRSMLRDLPLVSSFVLPFYSSVIELGIYQGHSQRKDIHNIVILRVSFPAIHVFADVPPDNVSGRAKKFTTVNGQSGIKKVLQETTVFWFFLKPFNAAPLLTFN